MDIQTVLDRPIAYHRCFVPIAGGVAGAVFLSQLLYWSKRATQKDGSIYKTQSDWEQETGLGRYEQETARKALREAGVLTEEKKSIPRRLYFKLDVNKLASLLNSANKDAGIQQASLPNSADKDVGIQQANTESTAENTAENTTNPSRTRETSPDGDGVVVSGNENPSSEKALIHDSGVVNSVETPKEKAKPKHSASLIDDSLFARFWQAYPRKTGKGAAAASWGKLSKPSETLDLILAALAWQAGSVQWTKDGGAYIPHPSTYLNQSRWLDEPDKHVGVTQTRHTGFIGGCDPGKTVEVMPGSRVVVRLVDMVTRGAK